MGSWSVNSQPRPQGFSRPTDFLREKPWGRGWSSPSNFLSCLIHDSVGSRAYTLRTRMEMNKVFGDYFKHFGLLILGDFWKKFICSSFPGRLMEEFPASKVHLQPATWLTGKFHRAKFKSWVVSNPHKVTHSSYYFKSPLTPWIIFSPATLSFQGLLFLPHLPPRKNVPEEQIFRGTDPLGAPILVPLNAGFDS